eukprot:CAMPEP_0182447524 /NCGR_PEP_ID=MMETSP1172-20130603/17018_1 /TAXON_ID=708627 /ORGANISM="Timspurckia oligopyrenoides, Strain CCMP3278" /LENGTH=221 /DNA_ID=CAMNT_0024643995 /DNA_START=285 /DNA_END=950 /DNA_ORIENTATION=-
MIPTAEISHSTLMCGSDRIHVEEVIGKGSSGIVYSGIHINTGEKIVIKTGKTSSLEAEIRILNYLKSNLKAHASIEELVLSCDLTNGLTAVVKRPLFESSSDQSLTQTLSDIPSKSTRQEAVRNIIDTFLVVLESDVAVSDVQFLIDTLSGSVLLIDVSESRMLPINQPWEKWDILDQASVLNFIQETRAILALESEYANQYMERKLASNSHTLLHEVLSH